MDPIKIGNVSNADVYMDGNRLVGRVKEFEVPEIGHKMVSHEALGSIGVFELPSRAIEPLKAKIVFDWLDEEVDRLVLNPRNTRRFQLHSYVDVWSADGLDTARSHKLITSLAVLPAKSNGLGHTLGEAVNREMELSVIALTQRVTSAETPIVEYDVFANIYRVNGSDVWPI